MKKLLLCAVLAMTGHGLYGVTPLWLRDVKISPDGQNIAFTYRGDIYKVPATGGRATRLTTQASYESVPLWSPDGKWIAFASDRNGSQDVFIMSSDGGKATRLTTYSGAEVPESFSYDGKYVLFSAAIQDPVKSALFPSARLTELYRVPVKGGRIEQILGTPAQMISPATDGSFFLYQDQKGMENEWRKHHTSSVTRDLWRYDYATGKHTNLTAHAGEDRNPVLSVDGKTMYFLSERDGGSMNVYSMPLNNSSAITQLTSFKKHPVRFLSQAKNGTFALTYDGEIYTMTVGAKPVKVAIDILDEDEPEPEIMSVTSGATDAVPSPDGKSIAFIKRGELFVTSVAYSTTKQITSTPQAESSPTWGADNRTLVYASERDGHSTLYKATIVRDDDPNFPNATAIKEEALFAADKVERENPKFSPDGKSLAFVADRSKIMVMDVKSKKVRQITDGSGCLTRTGVDYSWSPDSRWIVFTTVDNHHAPYDDIAIVNVDDSKPVVTNITQSGYFDSDPMWTPDGNAIVYISERYGMRNHASWGSQGDVMLAFLNQEAYDKFMLNEEDYELYKDAEKKSKDASKKDADDKDKKDDKKGKDSKGAKDAKEDEAKAIAVDRERIEDRTVRLTPYSSKLLGAAVTKDCKTLYYLSSVEKGYDLWKKDLRKGDISIANRLDAGALHMAFDKDGKNLFLLGGRTMKKLDTGNEKMENISYSATMKLNHAAEREYMLDYVHRMEKERFYTETMHGVDWDNLVKHYEKFLPHIDNNYDFSEMLSELLGELNVSHTGSGYRSGMADETTANLGLLYDLSYSGNGLKVAEVVNGGPFDHSGIDLSEGWIVKKVNGNEITAGTDYTALFNGIANKKTLVEATDPAGSTHEFVVRPISQSAMNTLLYKRWVKNRAADVERLSNGRLGYVHISSMDDASFRTIYSDILGKYNDCDGIVIDTRWNGGGRLHEDIEVMFSGEKYFTQMVRGQRTCDMPSRRWNKPSIMLQCEANYSNAHGTPWVYKHKNLGKLVGMPVPGTMTSVNWVTLQDPSLYFGIPVVGYELADGSVLENQQLEPDYKVANDADVVVTGEDQQLKRAVEVLLQQIDSKK
jgi:Tol biopolymer transport system component/C-terminal processing protease CtpA/Prc